MSALPRRTRSTSPLDHSALAVTITDLVAEYELRHAFRNGGPDPIEAVYSFPVPLDSAFMGMEATLAGEHLAAQILPRKQATRDYDDALAQGDSAVLLERLEPGLLCVNLGNLKPGEDGEITLRFAAPLRCAGGAARFSLPLVHRPRYGRGKLDELTEPDHDFAVEHPLQAVIRVRGLLGHAPVSCATHAARFSTNEDGQELRLNQAMLDRDLVLVFELPADFAGRARLVRDGDAAIGMLTFNVPAGASRPQPCDLCLVMDGSGSMEGDAVAQSRAAISAVADQLGDEDRIQVLRFGSMTLPLFRRPLQASVRVRAALAELSGTIDADLGGTDIGTALEHAIDALAALPAQPGRSRAIVLVTDGAVQPHAVEAARTNARKAGIRIFVVAVGSSAGADVLAPLATGTAGVLERAVPAEPIDEAVTRQLQRAREAGPAAIAIDWSHRKARPLPIDPAYAGDAVTAIAMLPGNRSFEVEVRVDGESVIRNLRLADVEDAPALRAIAGHAAWWHAPVKASGKLALHYGLVTDETAAVLVKVRADGQKVEGLPVVVPVAHMVPEGMVTSAPMSLLNCCDVDYDALDVPNRVHEKAREFLSDDDADHRFQPVDPAVLDALARALIHLLLDEATTDVTLESLLLRVDAAWRVQAAAYLATACPRGIDRQSAATLLDNLLEEVPGIVLSDDQEARFAALANHL